MNRINRPNDNVDENPNGFDQLNNNIREGYKTLIGRLPKPKKIKCKRFEDEKINEVKCK